VLMRRAFDPDVLRCPRCAVRMELIPTIDDPAVLHRILAHLARPCARDGPSPRPLYLPRETTSRRSPSRSRRDVAGPPARAVVYPISGVAPWCRGSPTPADRCRLTTPTDSGRIAPRLPGALSALCQAGGRNRR